jgi:tetratricopeptide (TPR) repeat protein
VPMASWVLAGVLAVAPSGPTTEAAHPLSSSLETWLWAVNHHVPGQQDGAVALLAPWSDGELDDVLSDLEPYVKGKKPRKQLGWTSREDAEAALERAAVLHAEIAVCHRTSRGYSLPSDGRGSVVVVDGRRVGGESGTVHWMFGRQLLDLVRPNDKVRLWYRATSAFLQSWGEYSELEPHLKRARELFPDDAVLLLYDGTLHESYAEPSIQNLFDSSEDPDPMDRGSVHRAARELREAEDRFERALRIDPTLDEARIRLALVEGARGRHEEAAADLRLSLAKPLPPLFQYLAWLLLGREDEALRRRDEARDAFTRASALYPGAQSPRLALSQMAWDEGDRAAATAALNFLGGTPGDDPWWSGARDRAHVRGVDELFAEMRRTLAP